MALNSAAGSEGAFSFLIDKSQQKKENPLRAMSPTYKPHTVACGSSCEVLLFTQMYVFVENTDSVVLISVTSPSCISQ